MATAAMSYTICWDTILHLIQSSPAQMFSAEGEMKLLLHSNQPGSLEMTGQTWQCAMPLFFSPFSANFPCSIKALENFKQVETFSNLENSYRKGNSFQAPGNCVSERA